MLNYFIFSSLWSKSFKILIIQHTVVNVSTHQLHIEVCNSNSLVPTLLLQSNFLIHKQGGKCFDVSGSLVFTLTIYNHPLQESEAVIKHFVLLLFSLKTVKYATPCTAVAVLFKWEMKLMYLSL